MTVAAVTMYLLVYILLSSHHYYPPRKQQAFEQMALRRIFSGRKNHLGKEWMTTDTHVAALTISET